MIDRRNKPVSEFVPIKAQTTLGAWEEQRLIAQLWMTLVHLGLATQKEGYLKWKKYE